MHVLLIERDDSTAASLMRRLLREGHYVARAAGAEEARQLAARGDFEVLLSELELPDGEGWRLMNELRVRHGMRGIAITDSDLSEHHELGLKAGFAWHLYKPLDCYLLLKALRNLEAIQDALHPARSRFLSARPPAAELATASIG